MPPPIWDPSAPRPLPARWGVDSNKRSNLDVTWDGQPMKLFDYVVARIGRPPEFWGRYFGSGSGGNPDNRLDADEVGYLHARNCKIALVYNGLRMRPASESRPEHLDGYGNGLWTARQAVRLAGRLGTEPPSGTRIYVDIENWYVDRHWFRGWQDGMQRTRFAGAGGVYGRSGHTITDRRQMRTPGAPAAGAATSDEPATRYRRSHWSRAATRAGQPLDGEQARIGDPNLAAYRRLSRFIWANDPRGFGDPQTIDQLFPPRFIATDVPGGARSVIWQYCLQCYIDRRGGGGPIDLDYAQEVAFNEMWG